MGRTDVLLAVPLALWIRPTQTLPCTATGVGAGAGGGGGGGGDDDDDGRWSGRA